jgi:hypothetical protein
MDGPTYRQYCSRSGCDPGGEEWDVYEPNYGPYVTLSESPCVPNIPSDFSGSLSNTFE